VQFGASKFGMTNLPALLLDPFAKMQFNSFALLGKPIDEAAKKVKIIGIDSAADSKAFTSFLTTDNVAENKIADKIKLVGFDSDDKLIKLFSDGTIVALVVQDPYRMGYEGVKTALAASKGQKVEANVDTGANLITKENMESARSQELLHPKLN
jgi:ABC-type sugar transport system substrate-binding protein